ncbi:MAG: class I SAM-dependent DNA methyltransferase [Ramlibacter sp.]
MTAQQAAEDFMARWRGVAASELATAQTFVLELCVLLGVDKPHPTAEQDYMFERPVRFQHGDGSASDGRIDCYRRGHFVLEAKKLRLGAHTRGFDDALLRARAQAEAYARALPAAEGRPPFVVVVDVGHVIELYAEFTRSGATYTPFPDPRSHRIRLEDLRDPKVRERLALVWTDPMRLDPARANAQVTREVAVQLAGVARSLEAAGHSPQDVAAFLTRCLFSMFAEDVDLLPRLDNGDGAFVGLLRRWQDDPATLQRMMAALWVDMDRGGFSAALAKDVLRFNGKLFKLTGSAGYALPLDRSQIDGLLAAARASWREVEPAIFGTLLERALDPAERHALGAHYTPRSYVERLVLPTVVEPLRADWANAQAAALLLANEANQLEGRRREDKLAEARAEIRRFHHALCQVRVLDPACGSGNFLYVTLEHLKRLEGEVVNQLEALGDSQARLHLEGETVTLRQLLGIELNERAAALAELVLWIGYLQWHIRTFGNASVAEPVVHDYRNIECRDAVLASDRQEPMYDAAGRLVTRWDWLTYKTHPVTGELVPDENARVPQWRYVNPRQAAAWPAADFIVGNPPYIGNKRMRDALGDGYVQALRQVWTQVPDTADFVMYWWDRAADLVRNGRTRRFGLITTNSLRQVFNRQTVQRHLDARPPLALRFAIPDHPWVDSANGAAVRVAMSVGTGGTDGGELLTSIEELTQEDGEALVKFETRRGIIHADLTVGAKVSGTQRLQANGGICFQGMNLVGKGFRLTPQQVTALGYDLAALPDVIKPHCNARDLLQGGAAGYVIDLFGLTEEQARVGHPQLYQWLHDKVKPEREQNNRASYRDKWWIFGEPRGKLRRAWQGLHRLIVTAETAKHRVFAFQSLPFCPDHTLYAICSGDALVLGFLSSRIHALWSLRAGGRLGVGNDPRWQNTMTFLPFPFPAEDTGLTPALAARIRTLAEQIDAHRKARQAAHDGVTLTGLYNVLDKLRAGAPLTARERQLHEHGLVAVLKSLHDELDAAVLQAYGWSDLALPADDDVLLERLVALNARRVQEEAAGQVRWLRPGLQAPAAAGQTGIELAPDQPAPVPLAAVAAERRPWPSSLPDQIKAIAELLSTQGTPLAVENIASHFTARGRWRERLPTILQTLEALGRARQVDAARWVDTGAR